MRVKLNDGTIVMIVVEKITGVPVYRFIAFDGRAKSPTTHRYFDIGNIQHDNTNYESCKAALAFWAGSHFEEVERFEP